MTVARYRQRVENVVNCWDEIYGKLFSLGRSKCGQAARQPSQARSDTENNLHFNWQLLKNNYGVEENVSALKTTLPLKHLSVFRYIVGVFFSPSVYDLVLAKI